jgi:hypothetical protein
MSNTNQNFEDSGGFGQDEAESEDHEMICWSTSRKCWNWRS